jgi:uncharacterized membrane protein
MAVRLITELALRIHLTIVAWLLAKMVPVATERLVKEVRLAIAALGMAGVGVPQITAVLVARWLLGVANG